MFESIRSSNYLFEKTCFTRSRLVRASQSVARTTRTPTTSSYLPLPTFLVPAERRGQPLSSRALQDARSRRGVASDGSHVARKKSLQRKLPRARALRLDARDAARTTRPSRRDASETRPSRSASRVTSRCCARRVANALQNFVATRFCQSASRSVFHAFCPHFDSTVNDGSRLFLAKSFRSQPPGRVSRDLELSNIYHPEEELGEGGKHSSS